MKHIVILIFIGLISLVSNAQNKTIQWDNTVDKNWPSSFSKVSIPSSVDSAWQKAIIYRAIGNTPRPLIVSLHTWSADYTQEDPISYYMPYDNYNYIHPDFRGANNNPKACCSKFVISDLNDAIKYAVKTMNVDTTEIHIIGASGGGYATLQAYMNLPSSVKSFSAWVPISNLVDWYWESAGRKQKYMDDVLLSTRSVNHQLNIEEAQKRSPYFQPYSDQLRKNTKLYIYTGVHDGYKGSVPITQSINMFNRLIQIKYPEQAKDTVSCADKLTLVTKQCFPNNPQPRYLSKRLIHFYKNIGNLYLTIFEGGHEQIVESAIKAIPLAPKYKTEAKTLVNIGDSNASFTYSWPVLLKHQAQDLQVCNYAIPGNTIGFDNLGNRQLNTLSNIDSILNQLSQTNKKIDYLIISLGSNDCKAIFQNRLNQSKKNIDKLLKKIKTFPLIKQSKTKIYILSIPPADETKVSTKYTAINSRIPILNQYYQKKVKQDQNLTYIDTYSALKPIINTQTKDGIHLTPIAQQIVLDTIFKYIHQL